MPPVPVTTAKPSCVYVGIDPGSSTGAAAVITDIGKIFTIHTHPQLLRFDGKDEYEIAEWFNNLVVYSRMREIAIKVCLEKVWAVMKGGRRQGGSAMFSFGCNYGIIKGIIGSLKFSYENPAPQTWQKVLGGLTKGDKKVSLARARRLWPQDQKLFTLLTAEAFLLAEYYRRIDQGIK